MHDNLPASFAKGRFVVERTLGKGGMGVVYQAFDTEREMRVALKTLLNMDSDSLYYFKKEFRTLHDIAHPNLCSLMELFEDDGLWFFTMELVEGVDFLSYIADTRDHATSNPRSGREKNRQSGPNLLSSSLSERPEMETPESSDRERRLRKVLAGLCAGLDALHSVGKVHRDIKPSNVMITEDDRVVLLDFGLIADNATAMQTGNAAAFIGSAAYMAPEQIETAHVGPKADLYSVGVMLYEVLTGQVPFDGPLSAMLVHKQTSDPPRPGEANPDLPQDLEILCMDLLSRNPRARPAASRILNIAEGYTSPSENSLPPESVANSQQDLFVGREDELQLLDDAYQNIKQTGAFETVIIEGASGIGKSALVEKFAQDFLCIDPDTVLLRGRCYERESAPFKAFDGVNESLVRHLKKIPREVSEALVPRHIDLLLRLFPSLRRWETFASIDLPKIEIEDARELQSRSFDSFVEMLALLGRHSPLVVIIDDMHWADADSLSLLEHLAGKAHAPPLLLILLSRYAKDTKDSLLNWGSIVADNHRRLHLDVLDGAESSELVRHLLSQEKLTTDLEAREIAREAAGHPLYIAELVNHIAAGGRDLTSARIDEVIWNRVKTLPESSMRALKTLCVAGMPIKMAHLKKLSRLESEEFFRCIAALRGSQLILSRGPGTNDLVEPYHARVSEAVVAHGISAGEATKINLEIGRFLLESYDADEREENIFSIVQHLFEGLQFIDTDEERQLLAELLLLAGKKARASAAFVASLVYFKESIGLFPDHCWESHYDSIFDLYCLAAETAYITGDFALTKTLVEEGRSRARSNLDKAKIFETYVISLNAEGKPLEAIDEAVSMIRRLGVRIPSRPSALYVLFQTLWIKLRLLGKSADRLVSLPHTVNPHILAARKLLSATGGIA